MKKLLCLLFIVFFANMLIPELYGQIGKISPPTINKREIQPIVRIDSTERFELFKKQHVGVKYVLGKIGWVSSFYNIIEEVDIITEEKITHSLNDIWECIDVTIRKNGGDICLVVKNQKGETTLMGSRSLGQQKDGRYWVYDKPLYDSYVKKFGINNMNRIRTQTIVVGMTDEMLKLSWGEPRKINRASYGDQWVYGEYDPNYVYVEKGKITAWN